MGMNRYFRYDAESCAFVEARHQRKRVVWLSSAGGLVAVLLAFLMAHVLDQTSSTPEEMALIEENEALQAQLDQTDTRIRDYAQRLEVLAKTDQELYRLVLQAEAIPQDVRQVGVGGVDPYEEFDRFSTSTAQLLRRTSEQLDKLERQISLQNSSYRELSVLAESRRKALAQQPAILPATGRVTSSFGMRRHPIYGSPRHHAGVDIPTSVGSPVYATGDGVIELVKNSPSGYGRHIVIAHPEAGYKTLYAHLSSIPSVIRPGRAVSRGERIGLSGNTGLSAAPHVHYEVQDMAGNRINPIRFFAPSMTPQQFRAMLEGPEAEALD